MTVICRYEQKQSASDGLDGSQYGQPYTKAGAGGQVTTSGYVPDEVEEALVAAPFGKAHLVSKQPCQQSTPVSSESLCGVLCHRGLPQDTI